MQWNNQQERAIKAVSDFIRDPDRQVFYLGGYAGTGKTTIARILVQDFGRWLFGAFTGKAAYVLQQKGCYGAATIHSTIYRPAGESTAHRIAELEFKITFIRRNGELTKQQENEIRVLQTLIDQLGEKNKPQFTVYPGSILAEPDVVGIVIDEVSMVDEQLAKDLESFGKKILVLGDPAQLPPVGAGGYYTKRKPDVMLTEIHRQAENSGILRLATRIREGTSIDGFNSCDDVTILEGNYDKDQLKDLAMQADQVLVGLNETRRAINKRHREIRGCDDSTPIKGDRMICLRNDKELGLFNGSQWIVKGAIPEINDMTVWMDLKGEDIDTDVEVISWLHHMFGCADELKSMYFGRRDYSEFDYAYALTVHKAQGSQWSDVVLFDQSNIFKGNARRWLYTGITRAADKLTVVL